MARRSLAVACLVAAAIVPAGCGGAAADRTPNESATLLLNSRPDAIDAGIYMAIARGYDEALGARLHVRGPARAELAARRLASGRARFAILDIHDLALLRERGRDLVGVMALVQTPLAAVLAQPSIRRPRDLEGHRVAVSGPRDDAVLRSMVAGDGGDPARVRTTRAGSGAPAETLLAGRVAGVVAPWSTAGVALLAARPSIREFRVEDYGAPAYPELVLAVTRTTLQDDPALVRATVAAIARGYSELLADPESGTGALLDAVPGLKRADVARALDAVSPSFTAGAVAFGQLVSGRLRAWAAWERRAGLVRRVPDVGAAFDGRYVPSGDRD